jgi:hypothetical protein
MDDVCEVVGEKSAADEGEVENRKQRDESWPAQGHY